MLAAVLMSVAAVALFVGPVLIVAWRLPKPLRVDHDTVDPYAEDGIYRGHVIQVIDSAERHVTMVRGEIPAPVYNEDVAEALRKANERGVEITLICGPLARVFEGGDHPVLALASEDVLKLYYSDVTQRDHFIEVDSTTLYWEEPHAAGALHRNVALFRNSYFRAPRERRRVLAAIAKGSVQPVSDVAERHVLITDSEFAELREVARTRGLGLDELSGQQIRDLLKAS